MRPFARSGVFRFCASVPRLGLRARRLPRSGSRRGKRTRDWAALRQEVAPPPGVGSGLAAGYVEYEGRFRFGFYRDVLRFHHDEARGRAATRRGSGRLAPLAPSRFSSPPECAREHYEAHGAARARSTSRPGTSIRPISPIVSAAPWTGDMAQALGMYARLRECSPAPYAALLCTPRAGDPLLFAGGISAHGRADDRHSAHQGHPRPRRRACGG